MAAPAGFNPSQPPPTLQDYQNEFQPTAEDINAVHGQRSAADVKVDEAAIRNMEIEEMPKPWSDPYFECQDLSQYHVLQPAVEFLRISRQYNTILSVWQKNFNFGKKIQQNPKLKLPEFARLDQAVNGDLEASNARRRRHLVGTIAYCWQLRDYIKKEKEWKRNQMERRKVIKPKKKKEKEKDKKKGRKDKNKSKTGKQEADDDEKKEDDEAEEEEQIEEEPNPYQWGQYTPKELYDKMAIGLVGCYFLCLCGFVPNEERTKPLYHQKKFDAVHVFATHMAKLVNLTTTDGKPLFKVILNMILIGSTGKNFLFSHHLHSCINFESKHSSQALKDQSSLLMETYQSLPSSSSKATSSMARLEELSREITECAPLSDHFIATMKQKAAKMRINPADNTPKPYRDFVYLRVFHDLGMTEFPKFPNLSEWGITKEDYDRIWRKIDDGQLNNDLRRVICGAVSDQAKAATAMDIDHHKLGIGPDYIKKKYQDLLEQYNLQRAENQMYDNQIADMLDQNTDFLDHYAPQQYNTNPEVDESISALKEDEINTTEFARKYLSGQFKAEKKENDEDAHSQLTDESKLDVDGLSRPHSPQPDKVQAVEPLPENARKLRQLIRRKERLLVGMAKQYNMKEEEVRKILELTDGRAVALPMDEFYSFYGLQPVEFLQRMMDPKTKGTEREQMATYLQTMVDSYQRVNLEKMRMENPSKVHGSLRAAVLNQQSRAQERVHHTKSKYTTEYFESLQRECEEFERKLRDKQQALRMERRQRIEEIKKLERKKRKRLTNPNYEKSDHLLSTEEQDRLFSLKEDEETLEQNQETLKQNIRVRVRNDEILNKFFDAEHRKMEKMNTFEAQQDQIHGPEDQTDGLGMDGFLSRESNRNYGKIIADKENIDAVVEQSYNVTMNRMRKRSLLMEPYSVMGHSAASSRSATPMAPNERRSVDPPPSAMEKKMEDRLKRLLQMVAQQGTITEDMKQDAKALLNSGDVGRMTTLNVGIRSSSIGAKSPSIGPREDSTDLPNQDTPKLGGPDGIHTHYKSESIVFHDNALDDLVDDRMTEERPDSANDEEDEDLKRETDDESDASSLDGDAFELPFDDINITGQDLSWLDTDELVPLSRKDMLDPEDIARLRVDEVPDDDVIIADGQEQRQRQNAVETLERSYMADAALKKAHKKEAEEMQKRLEQQKKEQEARALEEEKEIMEDILATKDVITERKSKDQLREEYAKLTPEQQALRRAERRQRRQFQSGGRNPQLLQALDKDVDEETVMVEHEVDDWQWVPLEETEAGRELAISAEALRLAGDVDASSSDEELLMEGGAAVDKRQQMVYDMSTKQLFEYCVSKTGMKEEEAIKMIDHGLNGAVIQIASHDPISGLDDLLLDIGFKGNQVADLKKILEFDGWKIKQTFPITMGAPQFCEWIEQKVDKSMVEHVITNGIDGKTVGLCIDDGGDSLKEMMTDIGIDDEKMVDSLRSHFVRDSHMISHWTAGDVTKWLKSVKFPDSAIKILKKKKMNGIQLMAALHEVPSDVLSEMKMDQATQSKLRGKVHRICREVATMNEIEIMYWIHAMPLECNKQIATQLYENGITGIMLHSKQNTKELKAYLASKTNGIPDNALDALTAALMTTMKDHGGFVGNYLIQDPDIMEFNRNTSSSLSAKQREEMAEKRKRRRSQKLQDIEDERRRRERRHKRVQTKVELGQQIKEVDGVKFVLVNKGKKTIKKPQRIRNFSDRTITLGRAANQEQLRLQTARRVMMDRRRADRAATREQVSDIIQRQIDGGLDEANELVGIREEDEHYGDYHSDASSATDSSEEMRQQLHMGHQSRLSSSRIAERLEIGGLLGPEDGGNELSTLQIPSAGGDGQEKRAPGRVTIAGQELEKFVGGDARPLFHARRASSLVQRIVDYSQNDLQNFKMRRRSTRMSRRMSRSMGGSSLEDALSKGGHSRRFSSGHFVSQFFKSATDRQKIEAGMRGEAPLITYYCEKDDKTGEIIDIHPTSVLETFIDDYSTFDDYIKVLSMRLEKAQRKHREEMDELRRHKEDLTQNVEELRTKKQELIRLIGQERSLMKRELPTLAKSKRDANAAQDTFEAAEAVIRDKFNDTKLHVMTMMQFRDNHLRKLTEEKAKRADIQAKIQVLKGDIEELLSHYFMLQNAHNKLEHTVALLSELTTLCHEVNVRKKTEYEREIKDLLAMIERYRCRIRNVDRLIEGYEKEVVELRMCHERRVAEFKLTQKNPTTNRTAATIDYYVAQRKLYEEKAEKTSDTFDDFMNINQKYAKEIKQKQTAFKHYEDRSRMADSKFRSAVKMKNQCYQQCRDLCKVLDISYKEAERKFLKKGHPMAQEFNRQYEAMVKYETDNKPADYEFVDAPVVAGSSREVARSAFDHLLTDKTHEQLLREQAMLAQGNLDRIQDDINIEAYEEIQSSNHFQRVMAADTMSDRNAFNVETARQMGRVHRGDPDGVMDKWRSPADRDMGSHPDRILDQMDQKLQAAYRSQHGTDPENLVNADTMHIPMGPSDDEEDDDDDDDHENDGGQYGDGGGRRDSRDRATSRGSRQRSDSDEPQNYGGHPTRNRGSSKSVRWTDAPIH